MSDLMTWAVRYGNMGFSIFPLLAREKRPFADLLPQKVDADGCLIWLDKQGNETTENTGKAKHTWEPFQVKRADDDQILTWWYDAPQANIGIVTGAISGIVVLDVDEAAGEEAIQLHGGLPEAPNVLTGNGRHIYFKHPGRSVRNFARKFPGLDFRGDGGYVVAPPSIHPSGAEYRWQHDPESFILPSLPRWLMDVLFPDPIKPTEARLITNWADEAFENELAAVRTATQGSRNATLNNAALKLGHWIGGNVLSRSDVENSLLNAALSIGLTDHEARATIRSGIEAGVKDPRTLPSIHAAVDLRAMPQDQTPAMSSADPSDMISIAEVAAQAKASAVAWANDPRQLRGLTTGIEELDEHFAGLLPNDVLIILGRTGGGKSSLAIHMMMALGRVPGFVFTTEMTPEWYLHRLASYQTGVNAKAIWTGHEGKNPALLAAYDQAASKSIWFYRHDNPVPQLLVKKAEALKAQGGQWMIIDSLNNVSTPGRSVYDGTKDTMAALRHIARDLGITVIATCQANRGPADRANKEPLITDAQGGGVIEQDATRFLTIYRPGYDIETRQTKEDPINPIDPNVVYLYIVKDRNFSAQGKRIDLYWSPRGGYTKLERRETPPPVYLGGSNGHEHDD